MVSGVESTSAAAVCVYMLIVFDFRQFLFFIITSMCIMYTRAMCLKCFVIDVADLIFNSQPTFLPVSL